MRESRNVGRRMTGWLIAVALIAAIAAIGGFLWSRPAVSWSAVAAAVGRQDTLHGKGRVYLKDGSEWEYALWARVEGPGSTIPNGIVRPVRRPPGKTTLPSEADPVLLMLCNAMDVCGKEGVITQLALGPAKSARARRTEWGGRPAFMVEVRTPTRLAAHSNLYPDSWRFFLDRDAKLILAFSMFIDEHGESKLHARCEYEYNVSLPSGFREK